MREIATFLGGIGLLIFAYLLLTNGQSTSTVLGSLSKGMNDTIMTLQGRTPTLAG